MEIARYPASDELQETAFSGARLSRQTHIVEGEKGGRQAVGHMLATDEILKVVGLKGKGGEGVMLKLEMPESRTGRSMPLGFGSFHEPPVPFLFASNQRLMVSFSPTTA